MFRDQSWRWDFFQTSPIFQLSSPKIFQNDFKTFVNLVNLERIITSINEKLTKRKKRSRVSLIYVKIFIQGPFQMTSLERLASRVLKKSNERKRKEKKKERKKKRLEREKRATTPRWEGKKPDERNRKGHCYQESGTGYYSLVVIRTFYYDIVPRTPSQPSLRLLPVIEARIEKY